MIRLIRDGFIPFDFIKRVLSNEEEEMHTFAQERVIRISLHLT